MRAVSLTCFLMGIGCRTGKLPEEDGALDTGGLTAAVDLDGDGYDSENDCDDNNSLVNPGAVELCDGFDNDCDALVDEGVTTTYYADNDEDGFGDPDSPIDACEQPGGYAPIGNDCDDTRDVTYPGAAERCDGLDNDCDTEIDEDLLEIWYSDADADGYGDPSRPQESCDPGAGYTADSSDCDDGNSSINPGAAEVCNGEDDDCDTLVDEGVTITWYIDIDGDGYGDPDNTTEACELPTGFSADAGDCDDSNSSINPGAAEVCNGEDDDCDTLVDEGVTTTYYADGDGDGFGDASATTTACNTPSGYVSDSSDCDDSNSAISPSAAEICNGEDDDCDGDVDEDVASPEIFYADSDGDGFGDPDKTTDACEAPSGYTDNSSDCDDSNGAINPDAEEACNGEDDDCDGETDNGILGIGVDCAADSCLDILTDDSSAADGDYWVVFDGTEMETACDMTTDGGGWTLIFEDDFESSPDSGWSLSSTYTCGAWSDILGGYGIIAGGEIDITVSAYGIIHSEAWVDLEYLAIDSWDGEDAYVEVDGATVWAQSQDNHSTSYSEVCGWDRGYYGSYDSLHVVSEFVSHTANSLELIGGSDLDQVSTDESFGLDDVTVWIR